RRQLNPGAVPGGSADLDQWWGRVEPVWHTLYLVLLGLAAVTTAISSFDTGRRWAIIALLAAMALTYLVLGWRLFREPRVGRAVAYLAITWLCFYGILYVAENDTTSYFLL